jgi:AhpD family alkylhydroperoxidase
MPSCLPLNDEEMRPTLWRLTGLPISKAHLEAAENVGISHGDITTIVKLSAFKEKELAAVGISIAAGCKPCTDFHVKKAREVGASEAEIKQSMSDAVSVRRYRHRTPPKYAELSEQTQ